VKLTFLVQNSTVLVLTIHKTLPTDWLTCA